MLSKKKDTEALLCINL